MDAFLFHVFNIEVTNPVFDAFFPWWTNVQKTHAFCFIFLPVILIATFHAAKWRGFVFLSFGFALTSLNDLLMGSVIKPLFMRPRPFDAGLQVLIRTVKPSTSSFPSSHASDAFFLATYLAVAFPKWRWPLFSLATLTAFSRVYCGVHYPGDVAGGALIGASLGHLSARGWQRTLKFYQGRRSTLELAP